MAEPNLLPFVKSWSGRKGITPRTLLLTGAIASANGCWEWNRARTPHGYGVVCIAVAGRQRTFFAHRLSYTTFVRPIIGDMTIDHLCNNRSCIRPNHLEQVTLLENQRRNRKGYRNRATQLTIDIDNSYPTLFEVTNV